MGTIKSREICPRYAQDMHEICLRYAQDMPEICQRYAQDMTTRKTVLTKRLPDKTSKLVLTKRLPDKTSKAVLTKRLPDKTSKAVLTKRLPDKTSILTKRLLTSVFHQSQCYGPNSVPDTKNIVYHCTYCTKVCTYWPTRYEEYCAPVHQSIHC